MTEPPVPPLSACSVLEAGHRWNGDPVCAGADLCQEPKLGSLEGGQTCAKPLAGADASSRGAARRRARPGYEAARPQQPQTDQQPNYTNTDLRGGKICYLL